MARTAAIICWRPSSAEHLLALLSAQIRPPRRVNTQVNELRAFRASEGVTSRVSTVARRNRPGHGQKS